MIVNRPNSGAPPADPVASRGLTPRLAPLACANVQEQHATKQTSRTVRRIDRSARLDGEAVEYAKSGVACVARNDVRVQVWLAIPPRVSE